MTALKAACKVAMYSETLLVTPAMAQKFLKKNISNRKVYPQRVTQYCHSILNGSFDTSHQGIAFDVNGNLVDGQHRLLAVIRANTPTYLYVTYNVPLNALRNIDRNRTRTIEANHAMATGEAISGRDLSVARVLWASYCFEHFDRNWSASVDPTEDLLIEFYHEHQEAIASTQELSGVKGVGSAIVRAALAAAYYEVGEHKVKKACEQLHTGIIDCMDQCAIVKIRDYANSVPYGGRTERQRRYTTVCGALLHYFNNRPLKRMGEKETISFSIPFNPQFRPIGAS